MTPAKPTTENKHKCVRELSGCAQAAPAVACTAEMAASAWIAITHDLLIWLRHLAAPTSSAAAMPAPALSRAR